MRFEREINIYGDEVILKRFTANETSISVIQGEISAIISESEMIELIDSSVTMYSKLASAIMDIDSLQLNFSELNTKYNTVSGQYTQLNSKLTQVEVSVSGLSANISQVSQNLSNNYSTTTQMNSAINAKANEISASVSSTYATKSALNTANGKINDLETWKSEASLKITDSAIISTVITSSNYENSVESLIEQNADSIRIQATKISWESTYSSMSEYGTLTCRNANIEGTIHNENGSNEIYMRNSQLQFIRNDEEVGFIGSNYYSGDNTIRGLSFDLQYTGNYMTWAVKQDEDANSFTMKWTYVREAFSSFEVDDTIYSGCDISTNGYRLILNTAGNTYIRPYLDGIAVTINPNCIFSIEQIHPTTYVQINLASFQYESIHLYRPTYANIVGTASDERLKTNISDSSIDALSVVDQFNFKEFDWIESGEHQSLGLIAQDVKEIYSELVSENEDVMYINPTKLLYFCVKAIQQLHEEVSGSKVQVSKIRMMNQNEMTLNEKKEWIENQNKKHQRQPDKKANAILY